MWSPKQLASGRFCCQHSRTSDTTDQSWETEAAAQEWATAANTQAAAELEARKARAANRKPRATTPTEFLTSRSDGWESSGK